MRSILVLFAALSACGYKQSNAIDLAQVEGMPVRLANVRMAESLYARLGAVPVKMSSGDAANAIGIAFDVHVVEAAAEYSGVSAQLACRVGEHTIVSDFATDANNQLVAAEVGSNLDRRDTFPPTPFADAIPSVCETTLWYTVSPPLTAVPKQGDPPPERNDSRHALGTVCFADDTLADGPCPPDVLPRVPASTPIAISKVAGRIGELQGGGHGVQIAVLATAGAGIPEQVSIGTEARCNVGDEVHDLPLPLFMFVNDLRPGESTWHDNATPPGKGLPTAPDSCTVEILAAENGTKRRLAEWCLRGEEATEGACG